MSESLVDLLLVRLGREEEKRKVLKLLITNLDLSVTDAENAVNNSPSVIKESVPMGEARIIQKDLYPYIDLLPRLEEDGPVVEPDLSADIRSVSRPVPDIETEGESVDSDQLTSSGYDMEEGNQEDGEDGEDENILITTASEEIRSTRRCHICGRTPVDGEKLAPCRTCSDLTCRDCFDRVAHVCSKCASEGKAIDRANEGIQPEVDEGLVFDTDESFSKKEGRGSYGLRITAAVFVFLLAVAAVFYFMDPMGLFAGTDTAAGSNNGINAADTTGVSVADTADTVQIADTTQVSVNPPDTAIVNNQSDDPFNLRSLVLVDKFQAIENPSPINFSLSSPATVHAAIPREGTALLAPQMETIAAWIPTDIDKAVFLVYNDTTAVLVLAILHPEETDKRIALMRETALWLYSSNIDQLVLIYRENRYQDAVVVSLVREVFPEVEGVQSPTQFQSFISYREDCWESISGPVVQWLSDME